MVGGDNFFWCQISHMLSFIVILLQWIIFRNHIAFAGYRFTDDCHWLLIVSGGYICSSNVSCLIYHKHTCIMWMRISIVFWSGYFIYDTIDMLIYQRNRQSYELMGHHVVVSLDIWHIAYWHDFTYLHVYVWEREREREREI